MRILVLPITPVPKPRMTQRDKWQKRPAVMAYRAFADDIRAELAAVGVTLPSAGLSVRFDLPMPASWSKRRRAEMRGKPHQQKPDWDNLAKALFDAAMPEDDSKVWQIAGIEKRWANTGSITLTLTPSGDTK